MENQQMENQIGEQPKVQVNDQQPQQGYAQQPQQGYAQQPQQGYAQQPQEYLPQPSSYLGLAIFITLCCCLPFGIIAIIKGNSVSSLYAAKQYTAALAASNEAKNWCIYGIVANLVIGGILGLIALIGGTAALSFLPFSDFFQNLIGG